MPKRKREPTKELVYNELYKLDAAFRKDKPDADEAAVLLASAHCGPSADAIASFLDLPRRFVRDVARRARREGIWQGRSVCADWFGKDGGLSFLMDLNCVRGLMKRA